MTACVNRKHTKKVAAVVTASLVGALSLGAAPVAAVADTGIETLATGAQDFDLGTVVSAIGDNNAALDIDNLEFTAGDTVEITVTKVKLGSGTVLTKDLVTTIHTWTDSNDDGKVQASEVGSVASTFGVGEYVAVVESTDSNYSGGEIYLPFSVVRSTLKNATIFDNDLKDPTDTTVTYDGDYKTFGNGSLGLKIGDKVLDWNTDYTVQTFDANGNPLADGPKAAGEYTAVVTGQGAYAGSSCKLTLTIEKLDLSKAPVTLTTGGAVAYGTTATAPSIASVKGLDIFAGDLQIVANDGVALEKGHYTYTIKLADNASADAKASITGEATAALDVVDNVATSFTYNGKTFDSSFDKNQVNLSNENHFEFNADKLVVKAGTKTVPSKYITFEIVNAETGETSTDPSIVNTPGKWYVTAKIDAEASNWVYGGSSDVVTFNVVSGVVKNATMLVTYNDVTANSFTGNVYSGEDYLDDIKVTVYDSNKNLLTEGEDYTVVVTKDGKEVDSIVDAGTYTITVKSDTYKVNTGAKVTFTVDPFKVQSVRVASNFADQNWIAYTGEEIVPVFEYLFDNKGTLDTEDDIWKTLPADVYTVTYEDAETGKEAPLKEVGEYTANIVISDAKGNFEAVDVIAPVEVSAKKVFSDVANNAWYSEVVYKAATMTPAYMNGYSGTTMFGPENSITRGEVACVLYNMAGGDRIYSGAFDDQFQYDDQTGYVTGFSDVDGKMYYAKAIAWAKATGIVNGYGDGTFAPDANITREEFAAMLSNYAAKLGDDVDGAEADLSSFADAGQISDWAEQAVEWAVANEVMGNGGFIAPTNTITRAEVAAMAVNYQPDGAPDTIIK